MTAAARHRVLRRPSVVLATACVLLALPLTACRDDRVASARSATVAELGRVVVMARDNTFAPDVIEVAPGTEVVWENRGRNDHDVISIDGSSWGVAEIDFPPGAAYSHVFDEPGTYDYVCTLHGTERMIGMVGTVVVTG